MAGNARKVAILGLGTIGESLLKGLLSSGWREPSEVGLDGLLDFCFDPEALLLYKKLCRHYYAIDLAATAEYVHAYRAMWDSEPEEQP